MTCYGRVVGRGWVQEWYESASGDARKRAVTLRRWCYGRAETAVATSPMGSQVTPVGVVRMTVVTLYGDDAADAPIPERIESMAVRS